MFGKQSVDHVGANPLEVIQLRPLPTSKPTASETHLLPVRDISRKQIFRCSLQNELTSETLRFVLRFVLRRDAGRKLFELVIEKWNTDLDRGSHAHLILLHLQLNQIRFDVCACTRAGAAHLQKSRSSSSSILRRIIAESRSRPLAPEQAKSRQHLFQLVFEALWRRDTIHSSPTS
jgi:hypothetical protein